MLMDVLEFGFSALARLYLQAEEALLALDEMRLPMLAVAAALGANCKWHCSIQLTIGWSLARLTLPPQSRVTFW